MAMRSIVFDSNPAIRRLLSEVMGRRGYEVFAYSSATPCLRCQGVQCADLIVADTLLVGCSGLSFAKSQIAVGCQNGRLAIMAASWNRKERESVIALGCQVFTKPFTLHEFESWLDEVERDFDPSRELSNFYFENTPHIAD